jgi:murein DD-endopeptidase MepM/ murein hydrolase activator NlpD
MAHVSFQRGRKNTLRFIIFIKKLASTMFFLLCAVFVGGCPNNTGKSNTADIPSTGGTISLEGIGSVTFPAGAFPATQQVRIETTSDAETNELFQLSAVIFSPGTRSVYEVRINTGDTQPQSDTVPVTLDIPPGLGDPSTVQVFIQVFDGTVNDAEDGFDELHDGFELCPSTLDANAEQLRVELPWAAFSAGRQSDGSREAVLILANTMEVSESSSLPALAFASGSCSPSSIGTPLEELSRIRGFNNTTKTTINGVTITGHPGTDYRAQDGDALYAVGDGTVVLALESNGKKLDKDNGGCGGVIVISIPDVGMVRYMHLKKGSLLVKNGEEVKCGQIIAQADNTGYSSGSHLHIELALGSSYRRNRVDLETCLDEDKCKDSFEGTFQFTWTNNFNDSYFIQSVEGTVNWDFLVDYNTFEDGQITLVRVYYITAITGEIKRDEDKSVECVGAGPAYYAVSDGILMVYPALKKYYISMGPEFWYNATCTIKEDGNIVSENRIIFIKPVLAFTCTNMDLFPFNIFPDDYIEYAMSDDETIDGTYSLNNCYSPSEDATYTISASWTFSKNPAVP